MNKFIIALLVHIQISIANESTLELNHLTTNLAIVSNRTDEGTSEYPNDLISANELLDFSLK